MFLMANEQTQDFEQSGDRPSHACSTNNVFILTFVDLPQSCPIDRTSPRSAVFISVIH